MDNFFCPSCEELLLDLPHVCVKDHDGVMCLRCRKHHYDTKWFDFLCMHCVDVMVLNYSKHFKTKRIKIQYKMTNYQAIEG